MRVIMLKTLVKYGPYMAVGKKVTFQKEIDFVPPKGIVILLKSQEYVKYDTIEEIYWNTLENIITCYLRHENVMSDEEFEKIKRIFEASGWVKV